MAHLSKINKPSSISAPTPGYSLEESRHADRIKKASIAQDKVFMHQRDALELENNLNRKDLMAEIMSR